MFYAIGFERGMINMKSQILLIVLGSLFQFTAWAQLPSFELDNEKSEATAVRFAPDGRLAVGSRDGKHFFWNVANKQLDNFFEAEDKRAVVVNMVFSPDGEYLASGGKGKHISLWDVNKGVVRHRLEGKFGVVTSLSFSQDGKYLASGHDDKKLVLWDVQKGTSVKVFEDFDKGITSVAFAHSKDLLAVSDQAGVVRVYDIEKMALDRKYDPRSKWIYSIAFSPNDKFLAIGGQDRKVKIYDLEEGGSMLTLEGHKKDVYALEFSPDGRYMGSIGLDGRVLIHELRNAKVVQTLMNFYKPASLSFSYDGKYLAIADLKTKIRVFDVSSLEIREDNPLNVKAKYKTAGLAGNAPVIKLVQPAVAQGETHIHSVSGDYLEVRGNVRAEAGLFMLLVAGKETSVDAEGNFSQRVRVGFLENEMSIKAIDYEKQVSEYNFIVFRPFDKNDVDASENKRHGKDYALVIGTDEYQAMPNLSNPVNDAKTVAGELRDRYDFDVTEMMNPKKVDILLALRELGQRQYADQDQLFIFIAGHGEYDKVFQEGYLVCSDSKPNDLVKESYLDYSRLRTIIESIPCKHIYLVMDACFGGSFSEAVAKNRGGSEAVDDPTVDRNEFIVRKLKYKTRRFLTSGGLVYVPDGRPGHHSPFCRRFLEALRSNGGKDRILTINELLAYVEKVDPEPIHGEISTENDPGSDFLFIAK